MTLTKLLFPWVLTSVLFCGAYAQCDCPDLPQPHGVLDSVGSISELISAIQAANTSNGNRTILLQPGLYQLTNNLPFISENMSNLTIRGITGNRDDVVIKGMGWSNNSVTHVFSVAADSFTVADMTIGEVFYHPIQVHSNPADADDFIAHNVRFVDAKEQLLKVSAGGPLFCDRGIVRCCLFEFTAGIAYQYYTGGIDAHRSHNWKILYNTFQGIRSPENNLAEHAIHFWRESEGTIIEGNQNQKL